MKIIVLENDELKIYRGEDFAVSKHIVIHQPTLNEITDYGEQDYYSMIYQLTATPQSMKAQLWDMGIDYTKISPWALFYNILFRLFPREKTSIVFGNLDFQKFQVTQQNDGSVLLYQSIDNGDEIAMDEFTYNMIADYLRKVHDIEKDERIPGNESTKMILIEDAKEELESNKNKRFNIRYG